MGAFAPLPNPTRQTGVNIHMHFCPTCGNLLLLEVRPPLPRATACRGLS